MFCEFVKSRLQVAKRSSSQLITFVMSGPGAPDVLVLASRGLRSIHGVVERRRRLTAVVLSIGLHGLLLFALLPSSQPSLSAGGMGGTDVGEGEGLSLDLTALQSVQSEALQIRELEMDELDTISESDVQETLAVPITEALEVTLPTTSVVLSSNATPSTEASAQAQKAAAAMGGEGQGGTSTGTVDELWNAIAPCWRRLADKETLPVTLTVSFAGNGMLAKPPVIERPVGENSNMQTLRSESLAITALSECGVYQMAAGREGVAIHFPKP